MPNKKYIKTAKDVTMKRNLVTTQKYLIQNMIKKNVLTSRRTNYHYFPLLSFTTRKIRRLLIDYFRRSSRKAK